MLKKYLSCFTTPATRNKSFKVTCSNKPKTLVEVNEWLEEQCPKCKFSDFNKFDDLGFAKTKHVFELGTLGKRFLENEKETTLDWYLDPSPQDISDLQAAFEKMSAPASVGHAYALYKMSKDTLDNF